MAPFRRVFYFAGIQNRQQNALEQKLENVLVQLRSSTDPQARHEMRILMAELDRVVFDLTRTPQSVNSE
jgi:hypothetical protein